MRQPTIDEVHPEVVPVCCGCGKEVNPTYASETDDHRLVCTFCAPAYNLRRRGGDEGSKQRR